MASPTALPARRVFCMSMQRCTADRGTGARSLWSDVWSICTWGTMRKRAGLFRAEAKCGTAHSGLQCPADVQPI